MQLGLARPAAHELVVQTVLGSAALARDTGEHPAELRNRVTTPGGTTAAGLLAMEEGGLRAALAHGGYRRLRAQRDVGRRRPTRLPVRGVAFLYRTGGQHRLLKLGRRWYTAGLGTTWY